jgi:hypothetical protein
MKKIDNKNENINNLDTEKEDYYKLNLKDLSFQEFIQKLKITLTKSKIFIKFKNNFLRYIRLSRILNSTRSPK